LSLPLLLTVGFLSQMVDGTLGMGYGVTSATLLISLGMAPAIVSASVHTAEIFVSLISGTSHFRVGNVRKDIFWPLMLSGIVGGPAGALLLVNLPQNPVRVLVGCVLLAMGVFIVYRFVLNWRWQVITDKRHSPLKLGLLGFIAASIDAMGGGGWGPICTPTLVIAGAEPRKAVSSVDLSEFFVTIATVLTFFFAIGPENFRWDVVVALMGAGLVAAPTAAFLCRRLPQRLLGVLVGIAIISLSARILLKAAGVF